MARKQPYDVSYDQATKKHLRAIEPKYHSLIRAAIEEQLQYEPDKETRNRKPLRQPAPSRRPGKSALGQITASACFMGSMMNVERCRSRRSV